MSRKSTIAAALKIFTPAALTGRTITAEARALATKFNPALEAAMNPGTATRERENSENWEAFVYGGKKNPKA